MVQTPVPTSVESVPAPAAEASSDATLDLLRVSLYLRTQSVLPISLIMLITDGLKQLPALPVHIEATGACQVEIGLFSDEISHVITVEPETITWLYTEGGDADRRFTGPASADALAWILTAAQSVKAL